MAAAHDSGDIHRPDDDELFEALEAVVATFHATSDWTTTVAQRLVWLRQQRADGVRFGDIARTEHRVVLLEAVNNTLEGLVTAGARARRLIAQRLYADGLTMDEVAGILGVSRQRVSRLLHDDLSSPGPPWTRNA